MFLPLFIQFGKGIVVGNNMKEAVIEPTFGAFYSFFCVLAILYALSILGQHFRFVALLRQDAQAALCLLFFILTINLVASLALFVLYINE